MRIIRECKLPEEVEKEVECHHCHSILGYVTSDICGGQHGDRMIVCPVCEYYVDV